MSPLRGTTRFRLLYCVLLCVVMTSSYYSSFSFLSFRDSRREPSAHLKNRLWSIGVNTGQVKHATTPDTFDRAPCSSSNRPTSPPFLFDLELHSALPDALSPPTVHASTVLQSMAKMLFSSAKLMILLSPPTMNPHQPS